MEKNVSNSPTAKVLCFSGITHVDGQRLSELTLVTVGADQVQRNKLEVVTLPEGLKQGDILQVGPNYVVFIGEEKFRQASAKEILKLKIQESGSE
jgi:hypothetical protein